MSFPATSSGDSGGQGCGVGAWKAVIDSTGAGGPPQSPPGLDAHPSGDVSNEEHTHGTHPYTIRAGISSGGQENPSLLLKLGLSLKPLSFRRPRGFLTLVGTGPRA